MRKIFILTLFISGLTFGQQFFKSDEDKEKETNIFQTEEEEDLEEIQIFGTNGFKLGEFFADQNRAEEKELIDQIIAARDPNNDDDFPTGPGPFSPIDDWLFILPIVGIGIGYYYLNHKKQAIQV